MSGTPAFPTLLLEFDIRHKRFGVRDVLHHARGDVHAGEVVSLVGASGCGKSTLLRLISGLDADYEGEVRLRGRRIAGLTPDIRMIFQEPRLFPWLTVAQNTAFELGPGASRDPRVAEVLGEVGLETLGNAVPKQLSGGQAQRVALARGLLVRPALLLLDEPFSAVDAFTRIKLQDLLLRLARAHHLTVLMVTHDIDEAVHVSDRVLVMASHPGHVAADLRMDLPSPRHRDDDAHVHQARRVRRALQEATASATETL